MSRSRGVLMVLSVVATVAAAGCSDDEPSSEPAVTSAAATAVADTAAPPTEAPTSTGAAVMDVAAVANVVDVTMVDYAFDAPVEIPAGLTRITATNEGQEVHHVTIARLEGDTAVGDALLTFATDPGAAYDLVTLVAGPQAVQPGAAQSVDVSLAPGRYALFCVIPSPTDGVPHAAKGMIHEVEVTGDEASASPADDVPTVGLVDYGFELPAGGLDSGTYRVENRSVGQPHELVVARVNDGSTYEDAVAALTATSPVGPPPITELDGVTALSPGEHGVIDLELAPGTYVLACYLPDASDGVPHVAKGMLRELDVG